MESTYFADKESRDTIQNFIGKTISRVWLDREADTLRFFFTDGSKLDLWDDGQSCCEYRYMTTDDDLDYHSGAVLRDVLVKPAPDLVDGYDGYRKVVHEVQFLEVVTSKGSFVMANHNQHNGYYSGFCIVARAGEQ